MRRFLILTKQFLTLILFAFASPIVSWVMLKDIEPTSKGGYWHFFGPVWIIAFLMTVTLLIAFLVMTDN